MMIDDTRNWLGVRTLYVREVRRFLKVYTQTLLAPIVTTLLFMAIFALALGGAVRTVAGVPFLEFLGPGLVMMAMAQNAFANTSSSIMVSKVQGNIVDILMPPLTAHELTLCMVMGGATRGLLVGLLVTLAMSLFVTVHIHHPGYIVFHAVMASMMLASLGIIAGIWSDKFDQMAGVTNFVITPLAFLSGTFYSIERLPEAVQIAAHFNPFFYMIDGFRYGFIGHADGSLMAGVAVLAGVNAVLWVVCYRMFYTGYKLKS
ncbi:MAG: ABC transporter permease [Rhodospirillales bacterium]